MNKKDLVVVALATFCLTATLFTILPTRSATNPYDPWLDTNDDGLINMRDVQAAILSFGKSGDATKSVHVTNPTYDARSTYFNISWTNHTATWLWSYTPAGYGMTGGYSRLFLHLSITDIDPSPVGTINTTIYVNGILWNSSVIIASYDAFKPEFCNATIIQASQLHEWDPDGNSRFAVAEFEVKAETIEYMVFSISSIMESGSISGTIVTYLRNE